MVGSIERLPALPDTYWDLTRTIERPDSSLTEVAAIVERDPAMSIKVLQLTNSAYFGLPQKTDSIPKAVAYLGLDNLKGLVLAAHVFDAEGAEIEREAFGTTHSTAGAYLLGVWGLPFVVVEVVAFHDEPGRVDHPDIETLAAVHMGAALAEGAISGREPELDLGFLERAGLLGDLAKWRDMPRSR